MSEQSKKPSKKLRLILCYSLIIIVLGLDLSSKYLATHYLTYGQPLNIFPSFNLLLINNTGAAFSLFNQGGWMLVLLILVAIVLIIYLLWRIHIASIHSKWQSIAMSFVVGGALGNLINRLCIGHVIDFLDLYIHNYHWPTFNLADTFICTGVIMIILSFFSGQKSYV